MSLATSYTIFSHPAFTIMFFFDLILFVPHENLYQCFERGSRYHLENYTQFFWWFKGKGRPGLSSLFKACSISLFYGSVSLLECCCSFISSGSAAVQECRDQEHLSQKFSILCSIHSPVTKRSAADLSTDLCIFGNQFL